MPHSSNFRSGRFLLIAFICITSTHLWSFQGVGENVHALFENINFLLLLSIVVYYYSAFPIKKARFSVAIVLFLLIPLLGVVPAKVFHQQPLKESLIALKNNFLWLMYFVLHFFKVPVKRLQQLAFFIGGVWVFLTVVQQFTYPIYYFATRSEETSGDFYRAGVYRFMLDDHHYGLFILFYFFYRLLTMKKIANLVPCVIALVGFYYYGTRQFALAALICIAIAAIAQKGKMRFYSIMFIMVFAVAFVALKEILFGGYIELTNEQLGDNEDNIRTISAHFFFFEYWPHWLAPIIGNGLEHSESAYGKEMDYLNKVLGLYKSDVGIIGALNSFGIFYALNILWINIKGLKRRFYTSQTQYLRLFFLNALLLLILSEYYSYTSTIPFFCIILYMVDQSFEEKRAKRIINKKAIEMA